MKNGIGAEKYAKSKSMCAAIVMLHHMTLSVAGACTGTEAPH